MNIHTAAIYMNQGYRIRRPLWHPSKFFLKDEHGEIKVTHLLTTGRMIDGESKFQTFEVKDTMYDFHIEDLLADDWEISEVSNETTS